MPAETTASTLGQIERWFCSSRLRFGLLLLAFSLLAVIPVVVVRFLPINDYPFHLARIVILSHIDNPIFARFYSRGSFLLPNVAMDAIALPMSSLLGAELAVRVFVGLTLVVLVGGASALHYAAHRRISPWPLLAFVLLHNGIFRFGFFNYLFGLGLAFLASAIWISMRPGAARLGVAFAACTILIFCHLEAFGAFALIVSGIELADASSEWRERGVWRVVWGLGCSALPFLLTLVFFALLSPTARVAGWGIQYSAGLMTKPVSGLFSLSSGLLSLDVGSAVAVGALLFFLVRSGDLVISKRLAAASLLLLAALVLLPESLMGATYADSRLGPAAAFLAFVSFDLKTTTSSANRIAVLAVSVVLACVRTSVVTLIWLHEEKTITPIVGAFDRIEPGSTVFAVTSDPYPRLIADTAEKRRAWDPPLKHVASYAVLHAPVFVPMIWSDPTQQPLVVRTGYRSVQEFQSNNPILLIDRSDFARFAMEFDLYLKEGHRPELRPIYVLAVGRNLHLRASAPFRSVVSGDRFSLLRWTGHAGGPGT